MSILTRSTSDRTGAPTRTDEELRTPELHLDASGAVLEQRSAPAGIRSCQGAFEAVLAGQLRGWVDELIVMAGMIGSRNGWLEVPYVACPAGLDEIAAGMREVAAASLPGRPARSSAGTRSSCRSSNCIPALPARPGRRPRNARGGNDSRRDE